LQAHGYARGQRCPRCPSHRPPLVGLYSTSRSTKR
jgi:hypothetical protein